MPLRRNGRRSGRKKRPIRPRTSSGTSPSSTAWWSSPIPPVQGLHVGHPRPYTAMDVIARKKRMDGYNVLFPIGYDAFGLPTENFAIKNHIHPSQGHPRQHRELHAASCKMLGYSFDWDREINTTDPKLLQVDPVDLPPAVQEGPGLQDHHARQLVHLLQVRPGQRRSGGRRLRALRQRRSSGRRRASGC